MMSIDDIILIFLFSFMLAVPVIDAKNYDIESVMTPVRVKQYEKFLLESNYPPEERKFLVEGFTSGFQLGYTGPAIQRNYSRNLPFTVGSPAILWEKIMKEGRLGRYTGPYKQIPYENFIQSPIGLVPKGEGGKDTHLIFHLSYDFSNKFRSVNYYVNKQESSVKYNDLDHAV